MQKNRGTVVLSGFHGQARDIARSARVKVFAAENGIRYVVDAAYKRDAPSIVAQVFEQLQGLLTTKRNEVESFKN